MYNSFYWNVKKLAHAAHIHREDEQIRNKR